jgi:hypothetical protein
MEETGVELQQLMDEVRILLPVDRGMTLFRQTFLLVNGFLPRYAFCG